MLQAIEKAEEYIKELCKIQHTAYVNQPEKSKASHLSRK